jgi:hypothetical protein
MASLDYAQIQDDLATLLRANVTEAASVWVEGMERETGNIAHMPLLNVRLNESSEELTNIPDGTLERLIIFVDVVSFSFETFKEAARLRDVVLKRAKEVCRANRMFTAGILTSSVQGNTSFGAAAVSEGKGHVALATFTVMVDAYVT